jgi:anti-sigma-K factor RskA
MNENMEEVMLDLLYKKAVHGLDDQEEKQLAKLERESGTSDAEPIELTVAALSMAGLDTSEPMPAHLRSRIEAEADDFFGARSRVPVVFESSNDGSIFNWFGWAVAAAACIALALNIYFTRTPQALQVQKPPATPTPEQKLTPYQMRQSLMASATDLARANLGPGKMNDVTPSGDVVWSDSKQEGYVRVSGLPKNDPTKETYQLWIMAENQDPKTPVDGGTFDITSDGEVIIPIDAKVKAINPQVFAITIEKPGGVPVSKQERVPALAKRETSL